MKKILFSLILLSQVSYGADFTVQFSPEDNSISTVKIQDNAVSSSKIQDGSVTASKIANESIDDSKVSSLSSSKISDFENRVKTTVVYLEPQIAVIKYDTSLVRFPLDTSYSTIPLTSSQDPKNIAPVSSNQITLSPGQYLVELEMYFYLNQNALAAFGEFRNVTDSSSEFKTMPIYTGSTGANENYYTSGKKIITLTSSKIFQVRAKLSISGGFLGDTWSSADGSDKVIVTITKIK